MGSSFTAEEGAERRRFLSTPYVCGALETHHSAAGSRSSSHDSVRGYTIKFRSAWKGSTDAKGSRRVRRQSFLGGIFYVFVVSVLMLSWGSQRCAAERVCTSCDSDVSEDYLTTVVRPVLIDFFYNYDGIEFARKIGGAVRILFHDSATYNATSDDGEPNGCLEMDDPGNGGIAPVTAALSALYVDLDKRDNFSRADFWQYAGLVATDVGFARVIAEGEISSDTLDSYNGTATTNYRFGRIDNDVTCNASGFWNGSGESIEYDRLPVANGDFAHIFGIFVTRMGMTLRELVAIVGAHTLGAATSDGSGNNGIWVEKNDVFDNQFYIDMLDMDWTREMVYFGVDNSSRTFQWIADADDGVELMMLNTDLSLIYQLEPASTSIDPTCTVTSSCAYNLNDDELQARLIVEEFAGGARGTTRNSTTKLQGMVAWYKAVVPAFIHMGELGYEDSLLEPCVLAAECTGGVVDNSSLVHTQLTILIDDTYKSTYHSTLAFRSVVIGNIADAFDMNSSRITVDSVRSGSVIVKASLYLDPIDDARQILVLRDDDTVLSLLQGAFASEVSSGIVGELVLVRSERISSPVSTRTSVTALPSDVTEDLQGPFQSSSINAKFTVVGSAVTGLVVVLITSILLCLTYSAKDPIDLESQNETARQQRAAGRLATLAPRDFNSAALDLSYASTWGPTVDEYADGDDETSGKKHRKHRKGKKNRGSSSGSSSSGGHRRHAGDDDSQET
eukprot:CAMPEP_0171574032 /NCGR_PEP_ID=MMETSP0961-20121227/5110_1 /TAXON_ID=87120 /ORGANISM="Aurantiochytrium limacinum, Strain ATCCMYA-1381" /LENGTH=731 /DNA_ID=CAMNT_0012129259 /DNA_START=56 /DNA_END=2248 /DNA_ORIENTATION=-